MFGVGSAVFGRPRIFFGIFVLSFLLLFVSTDNILLIHLIVYCQTLSLFASTELAFTHQGHDIQSSTSSTSQLAVASSFRQQTAAGTNIDERVSSPTQRLGGFCFFHMSLI